MRHRLSAPVFLTFCLVLLPVFCAAKADSISAPPAVSGKTNFNGGFTVSIQKDGRWEKVGTLSYDKHLTEKTLSLDNPLGTSGKVRVKIEQKGGGAAHIDSILLGGRPPVEVIAVENGISKLSKKDSDVIDAFGKTIQVVFDANQENSVLSLTARIESTVISTTPFQFPTINTFKKLDSNSSFYSYRLNAETGGMKLDGSIEETARMKPFFKEFSQPGSGHPPGYTYGWVWNDDKNLYVAMDFTSDNTMDGDKDYAKVYTNIDGKIKEFKVSVPEQTWGVPGFTYTENAVYQHKTYEFTLPLSKVFSDTIKQDEEIKISFAAYGTATPSCPIPQANITYTCPFTPTAPTINGVVSDNEWSDSAQQFNIPLHWPGLINTYFYCMVDGANLYILVDAVGDTTQSTNLDTCDECLLAFNDGTTQNVGEIYTETGTTVVDQMPAGGSGVVGFGTSQNSSKTHRIYEWKIPLDKIDPSHQRWVYFSSPAVFKGSCGAGASMPFDGTTNFDNVWPPCLNSGTLSTWGILQFPADKDGDGIPDDVEDAVPSKNSSVEGDGNADGIADRYQRNVTSLPSATGTGYITLQTLPVLSNGVNPTSLKYTSNGSVITGCPQNSNVQTFTEASQGDDPGYIYRDGLIGFKLTPFRCLTEPASIREPQANGFSALITVYFHGTSNPTGLIYRKYGPFPDPAGLVQWYTMPGVILGTATVGTAGQGVGTYTVATAQFTISDNGTGDDDPTLAVIVDQGGLGQGNVAIPTMNEWGMIIFMVLAGLGSVFYLRKGKKT